MWGKNMSICVNGDFNNYPIFWENFLVNCNLFTHETLRSSVWEHVSMRTIKNWNLEMLVFEERWKPDCPEKNLSEQGREPTTNPTLGVDAAIWIRTTLVGGECSHHCAIPFSPVRKGSRIHAVMGNTPRAIFLHERQFIRNLTNKLAWKACEHFWLRSFSHIERSLINLIKLIKWWFVWNHILKSNTKLQLVLL